MMDDFKKCPKCQHVYPRDYFGYRKNGHTMSYCPDCSRIVERAWTRSEKGKKSARLDWDTSVPGTGKKKGNCVYCDKVFYPVVANIMRGQGRYCSRRCAGLDGRKKPFVKTECENCGSEFMANPSETERGGGRFCSINCWYEFNTGSNNPLWREHYTSYRGRNWAEQREKAISRDGFKCTICGKTNKREIKDTGRTLSVHHISPYRDTQDNGLDNLQTVCASCHKMIEWGVANEQD